MAFITEWTDWEPTPELRYVVPPHTTTEAPRLQQRWFRSRLDDAGHKVLERGYDWRDVPRVVTDQ